MGKGESVTEFALLPEFDKFIKEDLEHLRQVASEQGWLVK